jgi:hypothetical protein
MESGVFPTGPGVKHPGRFEGDLNRKKFTRREVASFVGRRKKNAFVPSAEYLHR